MKPYFYDFRLSASMPFHLQHISAGPFFQPRRPDIHEAIHLGLLLKGDMSGLEAPACYLKNAWEPHGATESASGYEILLVTVNQEALGRAFLDGREKLELLFNLPPAVRDPRLNIPVIRSAVPRFAEELLADATGDGLRNFRQWLTIQKLFLYILDHIGLDEIPRIRQNPSRLLPAVRLVAEEPEKRHTVADGAVVCGLSQSRFNALFREFFGLSFGAYELNYRLNGAEEEIRRGDKLQKDIVKDWGFYDESHLRKALRRKR